jgi:hypothetical protein
MPPKMLKRSELLCAASALFFFECRLRRLPTLLDSVIAESRFVLLSLDVVAVVAVAVSAFVPSDDLPVDDTPECTERGDGNASLSESAERPSQLRRFLFVRTTSFYKL